MYNTINQIVQKYSEKKYSFITGNGTSAIYLALKASNLPKDSKVAIPNISCPDPVYAALWAGYEPVFIDVNVNDYNMDIKSLENELKRDRKIKAIIAIHLFGNSCDIVSIFNLAKKYSCFLIEDCAQAFGNEIDKGKLGSFGDVSIFSFGHGKIIEVGEGGSIQTNNRNLMINIKKEYKKLNEYNAKKKEKMSKIHRGIYYKLYYLGLKYPKLNILNLVYPYFFKSYYLHKLNENRLEYIKYKLENFQIEKRERIAIVNKYITLLQDIKNIKLPTLHNKENVLSRFTIVIDNAENISKKIRENNIPSNTMYPMLVDRFQLFFNSQKYRNSFDLRGKMLNLWTNNVDQKKIEKTIEIIKDRYE